LAEATARPGLEAVSWHALVAPAATPRAILTRLHAEMVRIMTTAEIRQRVSNLGLIPIDPPSIEETQQYIAAEAKRWGELVRRLGLAGSQ
jgi:tripartite-type tricarboxylate transporter receptor subunit TctC